MKRNWEDNEIEFRAKRTKLKTDTEINNAGRKNYVIVENQEHVQAIYTHGFFGTIIFNSASVEPEYETKTWQPGLEFEAAKKDSDKKWEEKEDFWKTDQGDDTGKEKETEDEKVATEEHNNKADDKMEGEGPQNWSEVASFNQKVSLKDVSLHLELCEAFYLSFAIGCLVVSCDSNGQEMTLIQMWKKYCKLEQDFPYRYAVYQYFRSRGWVTRSGYTMGSDWLLYKLGPPFYHATFTVIVEAVSGETGQILPKPGLAHPLTWTQILALNRLNENVNKNLLLARVEEHNLQPSDFESPFLISKLAVSLKRGRLKPRMADNFPEETFRVGSIIKCELYTQKTVEGEVVAWDQTNRVLILKSESKTRSNLSNVQIINLEFVTDIQDRAEVQIQEKKRLVAALQAGASVDAQRLFQAIRKTIEEVSWRNQDIIVMDKVLVTKPYTAECVKALNEKAPEKKAIDHVRKIVEKHYQDRGEEGKIIQQHRGN